MSVLIYVALLLSTFQAQANPLLILPSHCPPATVTASSVTVTLPGNTIHVTLMETLSITTGTTTLFIAKTSTQTTLIERSIPEARNLHSCPPSKSFSFSCGYPSVPQPTSSKPKSSKWTSCSHSYPVTQAPPSSKASSPIASTSNVSVVRSPTTRPYSSISTSQTTCTDGITATLPGAIVTMATDVTITAATTVTIPVLATTIVTSDKYKVRVKTPTSTTYDGKFLDASPDTATTGAFAVIEAGTVLSVDAQGRLVVNDPTNDYNGYIAYTIQNSGQSYRTVELAPNPSSNVIFCTFAGTQLTCTDPASGNSLLEVCGNYLRLGVGPLSDGGDCAVAALTAVDPTTT